MSKLDELVAEEESYGCTDASRSLGIQQMPAGYALLIDFDSTYFFWLHESGAVSAAHWNKWAIYRSAKTHAKS